MSRRPMTVLRRGFVVAVAATALVAGGAAPGGAATTIPLGLSQSTAFSMLGHSCGGIQEHVFATGFDAISGYPTGDVYMQTRCGGSGRGGGYHSTTYSAWADVTWDLTGAVISAVRLAAAPTVDPALTAFDAFGNEVSNVSNTASLVLVDGFVPAPRVTGLSVNTGPSSGGTTVTISGTGFDAGDTVSFGAVPAASVVVNSSISITAVTPATSAGTIDVVVANAGGGSATSAADQFAFVDAPTVTGIDPASGPTSGGTSVTITGTNFTDATAVSFGGVAVGFTVDSDTSITATSAGTTDPPGDPVDVTVTTPGGTSASSSADRFTYTAVTPDLFVTPDSGPAHTHVVLSGDNFQPGEMVRVSYLTGLAAPHRTTVAVCHKIADATGSFTCRGRIPGVANAGPVGDHEIVATGALSASTAAATFTRT